MLSLKNYITLNLDQDIYPFGNKTYRGYINDRKVNKIQKQVEKLTGNWQRYDQNISEYLGIWINEGKREVITFLDGEIIHSICKNKEGYIYEHQRIECFYNDYLDILLKDLA